MNSNKLNILAIGYNYREINEIQDALSKVTYRIHFDFAISIRDSLYRLNITNYEIVLLDLTSSDIDSFLALQEIQQKGGSIPIIVAVTREDISRLSETFGSRTHYFIGKDEYYAEAIIDCVEKIQHGKKVVPEPLADPLKKQPRFLEDFVNTVHDQVMVVGPDYCIHMANEKILEKYNCAAREIIGQLCYKFIYNFDKPCPEHEMACPLQRIKLIHKSCEMVHTQHNPGKGRICQTHISALPLFDTENNLENVLLAIREEKIPLATQFDKQLLYELIDGLTEGLIFCDMENRIVLSNKAADRMLNVEHGALSDKSFFELPLEKGTSWLGNILKDRDAVMKRARTEKFLIQNKWITLRFVPLFNTQNEYIGGFLYLTEKVFDSSREFDPDLITVSRLFSSKIVAEG